MPTYEYQCAACGHHFEKFQSITAAPIRKCPKCAKKQVRRLLGTGAGLIFKGSGFYTTDYRSENYKSAAKAESGGDAKPATGEAKPAADSGAAASGSSGETKPAAPAPKPESKPAPKGRKK